MEQSERGPVEYPSPTLIPEFANMCDYSLHSVSTRPAKLGDRLITSGFSNTPTRGFHAIGEPNVAVCLQPGTELAFETEAEPERGLLQAIRSLLLGKDGKKIRHKVGRFRQIDLQNRYTNHDALEFPDGQVVLVTNLRPGQRAMVLQLPASAHRMPQQPARDPSPQPASRQTREHETGIRPEHRFLWPTE
jgi:hypothetical protein